MTFWEGVKLVASLFIGALLAVKVRHYARRHGMWWEGF